MCTSKPKVPKATPVIERQAYKSPVPRGSLDSGDAVSARRRRMAGIATSAAGVTEDASTTRNVLGGAPLSPAIGGGGGSPVTPTPVATSTVAPTMGATTPATSTAKKKALLPVSAANFILGPVAANAYRQAYA